MGHFSILITEKNHVFRARKPEIGAEGAALENFGNFSKKRRCLISPSGVEKAYPKMFTMQSMLQ